MLISTACSVKVYRKICNAYHILIKCGCETAFDCTRRWCLVFTTSPQVCLMVGRTNGLSPAVGKVMQNVMNRFFLLTVQEMFIICQGILVIFQIPKGL